MIPFRISGTGAFLPEQVRLNSWYPAGRPTERKASDITGVPTQVGRDYPLLDLVIRHMVRFQSDPFRGARERRVMAEADEVSDLQARAAAEALARAGCPPEEVELLLDYALPMDRATPSNAGLVQRKVGATRAMAFAVDSGCSTSLSMLSVAARHLATGTRRVLCALGVSHSRLLPVGDPVAPSMGDGAAALVLEPARNGGGLLGYHAHNEARLAQTVVCAPLSGRRWYQGGEELVVHAADAEAGKEAGLRTGEFARTAIGEALKQAGLTPEQVDVFVCHQPVAWFGPACQEAAGLGRARLVESFAAFGSVAAASVPLNLHLAVREGLVRTGSNVVFFSNGAGFNHQAAVVRWD